MFGLRTMRKGMSLDRGIPRESRFPVNFAFGHKGRPAGELETDENLFSCWKLYDKEATKMINEDPLVMIPGPTPVEETIL